MGGRALASARDRLWGARADAWSAWCLRSAQSVGLRARIEGRPRIESHDLRIGDDLLLWSKEQRTYVGGSGRLELADRVFVNSGAYILAHNHIVIGDDVAIGLQAVVVDTDMHGIAAAPVRHDVTVIGAGTWIAMRATVLGGVRVGKRCIVAAGAVVTGDVPDDTLVAGVPARPIRRIDYPEGHLKAWNNDWRPEHWADGGHARIGDAPPSAGGR